MIDPSSFLVRLIDAFFAGVTLGLVSAGWLCGLIWALSVAWLLWALVMFVLKTLFPK